MTKNLEGLILHVVPYQENSLIGSLFTKYGVLSFLSYRSPKNSGSISPISLGQFELTKKTNSNLYKIKSFQITDQFLSLRKSYDHLQSACQILKTLKDSQAADNPSPNLFNLSKCYLKKLGEFEDPKILEASFLIKFLRHEGCLRFNLHCSNCKAPYISKLAMGDFLCESCADKTSIDLSANELKTFFSLGLCRSFADLKNLRLEKKMYEKVKALYEELTI